MISQPMGNRSEEDIKSERKIIIEKLKDKKISIQTYATEKLAKSRFENSWWNIDFDYEILKVNEKIELLEERFN